MRYRFGGVGSEGRMGSFRKPGEQFFLTLPPRQHLDTLALHLQMTFGARIVRVVRISKHASKTLLMYPAHPGRKEIRSHVPSSAMMLTYLSPVGVV